MHMILKILRLQSQRFHSDKHRYKEFCFLFLSFFVLCLFTVFCLFLWLFFLFFFIKHSKNLLISNMNFLRKKMDCMNLEVLHNKKRQIRYFSSVFKAFIYMLLFLISFFSSSFSFFVLPSAAYCMSFLAHISEP